MLTEANNYSSTAVEERVRGVLEEVKAVVDISPWGRPIHDRTVNALIPYLRIHSNYIKDALSITPSAREILYQIKPGYLHIIEGDDAAFVVKVPVRAGESPQSTDIIQSTTLSELRKNALSDEEYYRRLMKQSDAVMRLFTNGPHSIPDAPAEIPPYILSLAANGFIERRKDYELAIKAATEATKNTPYKESQFRDIASGAVGYEVVSGSSAFPLEGGNWNRILLDLYLKGMFDVGFQRFEPLGEKGVARTGLRAHFLRNNLSIGCWAEWDESVRAYHDLHELEDLGKPCSTNSSYASRLWDKILLSLRLSPDGNGFNHRLIDRTQ